MLAAANGFVSYEASTRGHRERETRLTEDGFRGVTPTESQISFSLIHTVVVKILKQPIANSIKERVRVWLEMFICVSRHECLSFSVKMMEDLTLAKQTVQYFAEYLRKSDAHKPTLCILVVEICIFTFFFFFAIYNLQSVCEVI